MNLTHERKITKQTQGNREKLYLNYSLLLEDTEKVKLINSRDTPMEKSSNTYSFGKPN